MQSVKLSDELVNLAKIHAKAQHRSIAKQIEYWAKLGRIAKENPDLPLEFIENVLEGLAEAERGEATEFTFIR